MTNSPLNRKLAAITLCVACILLLDTFVLKPRIKQEVFSESNSSRSGGSGRYGGTTFKYYVIAASGNKYKVPFNIYLELSSSEGTFYVYRTLLFGRAIQMRYNYLDKTVTANVGVLNSGRVGFIIILYAVIISLLNIFPFLIIKRSILSLQFLSLGTIALAVVTGLYFFW